jgi:hypothetical protein
MPFNLVRLGLRLLLMPSPSPPNFKTSGWHWHTLIGMVHIYLFCHLLPSYNGFLAGSLQAQNKFKTDTRTCKRFPQRSTEVRARGNTSHHTHHLGYPEADLATLYDTPDKRMNHWPHSGRKNVQDDPLRGCCATAMPIIMRCGAMPQPQLQKLLYSLHIRKHCGPTV